MRRLFVALSALASLSCRSIIGPSDCGPETRVVDAWVSQQQGGSLYILAHVELTETSTERYLTWIIQAPPLKGHVQDISLRDARDTTRILTPIAVSADTVLLILAQGFTRNPSGNVPSVQFHDLLLAGNGLFLMRTDIPATPILQFQLSQTFADTFTSYCD